MYVKELTIRGFKSFAHATTLRFEPGVTAIVGPNGSGKSNVVDALAWVMGEQGAKSLRGTSMEDVIFAGTSTHAPLGRAQVILTIDNSDGTLDIDYSEVSISRTIYRNGGSEYSINGSPVRLLDVQELLSDTGLGSHMHVVVGQGRLDSILRATPQDNRAFIEEAAGILKHRRRKERALRKLKSTQDNVDRLDDLINEIHRQMGPLRRQAKVSRRADSIQVIIRDASSRLLADEASTLLSQRDAVRHDLVSVRKQLQEAQQQLTATKLDIERLEGLSSSANPEMNQLNQDYHRMTQLHERLNSLSALAREREHMWRSQIVTATGDDPDLLRARAQELQTQQGAVITQTNQLRLTFDKVTERRAVVEQELASVRQLITQMRTSAQEQEAQKSKLREEIARQEAQIQGFDSRLRDNAAQAEDFARNLADARSRLTQLQAQNADAADNLDEQHATAQQRVEEIRSTRDSIEADMRQINNAIISLRAKADALNDTLEARNNNAEFSHSDMKSLGKLAEFIRIEEGWEEAIAQALGPFASSFVVQSYEDAARAVHRAHDKHLGKASVVYSSPLPAAGQSAVRASKDTLVCASDVVSLSPQLRVNPADSDETAQHVVETVKFMLCDVALAHTVEEALHILQEEHYSTVITQDGDTFTPFGATAGASHSPSDLSLVARRDKALAHVAQQESVLQKLSTDKESVDAQYAQAREKLSAINTAMTENRVRMQQRENDIQAAQLSIESLTRRISHIDEQKQHIEDQKTSVVATLENLKNQLSLAQTAKDSHIDLDASISHERELDQALTQERQAEVTARLEWNNASQHSQSLERQITLLVSQAQQADKRREKIARLNEDRQNRAQEAARISQKAQEAAGALYEHIQSVLAHREKIQTRISAHDEQLKALRQQRNEQEPVVDQLSKQEHDLDIARERIATQYGQISQRSLNELGSSLERVIEQYGPSLPVPVFDDFGQLIALENKETEETADSDHTLHALNMTDLSGFKTEKYERSREQKKLDKARRDLAALGKVNPLATEEFDALQERHKYLVEQRDDVVKSRNDLLDLIKNLDSTMIEVFESAFEDTAQAFTTVFASLFPGGKGRLVLEDPSDMLSTGVIVEASPAGKRVKQLSLLSGGERSLTALALLFAIFTARPSPFYILDEVEAALDDVNLTRLLGVINDLRAHAQIIVITHQQRTMSIADALYGVTMRSDGITAVVSQKLGQGEIINNA
ncbi:chromosome segregation protein SMC [Alloscardovia criceti]|uniref:chromosome segregation protein SMC n=1 Tax=Alloscardovia criceti TaxID=356828 RepID=UPI00037905AC|nr:chromosome segregation protein SMC [Alloscardovia criceti]